VQAAKQAALLIIFNNIFYLSTMKNMMHGTRFIVGLLFVVGIAASCDRVKGKTKDVIGKTGETVGEGTSEFVNGVSKGVDQTFECKVELSQALVEQGLKVGKFYIPDSAGINYTLSAFVSFEKDFNRNIMISVFDEKGKEYGRMSQWVENKAGEGKYIDFVFDRRTDIESRSKFVLR
jgi:hypothetical protein